jgi:branched-chain amino acid transport system permease protein
MFVDILFQTLAYASVLYLISVGLSVTLGLMRFANLAHGVFAMAGGYLAAIAVTSGGLSWYAALLVAPIGVGLIAAGLERLLYARLYGRPELDQVLFCIGLIFMAGALARQIFGPLVQTIPVPPALMVSIEAGGASFLGYKVLTIAVGATVAGAVFLALERTRAGAMVRAAVDNRGMAESIGIRTRTLFTATFALGGALAALGGIVGAEVFSINPAYALDVLVYAQLVVAIGGLGTARGAFLSAMLIALIQTVSAYVVPELGTTLVFSSVFLFLLWRPQGLFGRRESFT